MLTNDFFVILEVIGMFIMVGELIYIIFQKPSKLQKILIILTLTCIISFVAYYFELIAKSKEAAYFSCLLGYVSKPYSLLSILMFLAEYSHVKIKKWVFYSILIFFLFITVMVFTNEFHHLYYTSVDFKYDGVGSGLLLGHGILWYLYMASSFIIFIGYTIIGIMEFKKSKTTQAKQMSAYIIAMLASGIIGLACFTLGWTGGYDTTLTGTFVGALILLILFVRYRLFDSITLAKEQVLINTDSAVIVFDGRTRVSFHNPKAEELIPELKDVHKMNNDYEIFDKLESFDETKPVIFGDKAYKLIEREERVKRLGSINHEVMVGKTFVFDDITDQYNYQERLLIDVKKATHKVKDIQRSVLISFANLIEARDGYTGTHVRNVAINMRLIAKELANVPEYAEYLNKETIEILEECAPLHDVGKIMIPDSILGKPGKLTPEEFELMKTHTIMGGKTIDNTINNLEESSYVEIAKEIAVYHHEWWNGAGYPYGLKGNEIPISARIMAVADVYDALRMKRPYKDAYSKEKSVEIIKEETGTHFDPTVVEAFLKIVDQLN